MTPRPSQTPTDPLPCPIRTTLSSSILSTLPNRNVVVVLGPVRERGLVEQVVGAAFQTYEGVDPHPGPFEKAAMLLRGIIQGHPFNDGNKRTGFLTALYYLDLAGYSRPAELPVEEVVDLCVRVSSGQLRDVHLMARKLERLWTRGALEGGYAPS